MGDGILDHERVEPPGMCDREPEPHRAAVVLHDQGVAAQAEDLGETADDSGQVVEGVGELGVAGRVAVPEPGIVRCNQAERAGEPVQQRLPHPRGGGKSVQQQDHGRVWRAGVAVEDLQAVDIGGTVGRSVHGCLRSRGGRLTS